jgi:hypothetical protein
MPSNVSCNSNQLACPWDSLTFCIDIGQFNFDYYELGCSCPPLNGDPDIAGNGVSIELSSLSAEHL